MGEISDDGGLMFNIISEDPKSKKINQTVSKVNVKSSQDASPPSKKQKLLVKKQQQVKKKKKFPETTEAPKSPVKGKTQSKEIAKKKSGQLISSSLFTGNPMIVPLDMKKTKSVMEPLFSAKTFEDFELHPHLVSCLKSRMNIVRATNVQEQTIPLLLKGQDALVKSCTGSGKTLAYAVPIVQKLQKMEPKIKRSDGVYALIVVPTRELAVQCFETFSTLTKAFTWIVPGFLIGGEKKKSEKARLRKGINILVSTPGRLLDHLEHTKCLSLKNIAWLVIDEADRLLEMQFENDVKKIISFCFENRQSTLLSATLSKGVQNLAGVSLKNPVCVDISTGPGHEFGDNQDFSIPTNLKQKVVIVPPKLRLIILSSFIIDNHLKGNFKALVFMSSQGSVDFHFSLLSDVLANFLSNKGSECKFFKLHGHMKQDERMEIFHRFKLVKEGVLFCTDVAARGLDLPHVDWIVQYSAPESAEIYVHRVGRTARIGKRGNSLLFLLPSESNFPTLLTEHKINLEEVPSEQFMQSLLLLKDQFENIGKGTPEDCATALQTTYEKAVYGDESLHQSAKDAFSCFIKSYKTYPRTIHEILPFNLLHLGHIAKSFCLKETPSRVGYHNSMTKSFKGKKVKGPKPPMKRKFSSVSEFDSGLSSKLQTGPKRKKAKR